jgi:hypothetical protein
MPKLFCGTGWNDPVPGRELHPLKSGGFHGALLRQLTALTTSGGSSNSGWTRLNCEMLGWTATQSLQLFKRKLSQALSALV